MSPEKASTIRDAFKAPYTRDKFMAIGLYDNAGYCEVCTEFYCSTHWNSSATGWGCCPNGHFKSLDPHWSPEQDGA